MRKSNFGCAKNMLSIIHSGKGSNTIHGKNAQKSWTNFQWDNNGIDGDGKLLQSILLQS